jgi:type IV pilus assembly protein PilC
MPSFRYRAIDNAGERVRDTIEAAEVSVAVERLRTRGLIVTEIDEVESSAASGDGLARLLPIRAKEVALFFRMFAALVKSNIPISEGIGILCDQTDNKRLQQVLHSVKYRIEGGVPLSQAMEPHQRVFGEMIIKMVKAGELGGMLDIILERIADFLESRSALRAKMITSMIYPAVVVVVTCVVVVFLVTFVIPKFSTLLGGRKLPANTQFLLDAADLFKSHGGTMAVAAVALIAGFFLLMMLPDFRLLFDRLKIRLPMIGPVFRYGVVVQFANTISSLLQSGITLVDALKATSETLTNEAVKRQMVEVTDKVAGGVPLSAAMAHDRFFPPLVRALVTVGEYSGLLDEAWEAIGQICDKILRDRIARMSAVIEPVLIITLGTVVGYVAWGLIAGMLSLYGSAGK